MNLIVAVNNKWTIGRHGVIPWRSSADLKHFKHLTMGGSLIVGKATYEDCLKGKKLPGRRLFVVGEGYLTLGEAVRDAVKSSDSLLDDVWVIGGKSIYDQLAPLCDHIHISFINNDEEGDTHWAIPANYRGLVHTYNFEEDGTNTKDSNATEGETTS